MARHSIGEPNLSDNIGQEQHHMLHHFANTSFINQEGSGFGGLEEAIVLQNGVRRIHKDHEANQTLFTTSLKQTAATLEMFPSWPIRFPTRRSSKSGESGDDDTLSGSAVNNATISSISTDPSPDNRRRRLQPPAMDAAGGLDTAKTGGSQQISSTKQTPEKRRGPGSHSDKVLDAKTQRRLAQNREAARKSRLRKKAYVQQLESSRIRLSQLEQDLQKARSQGLFLGGSLVASGNLSSGGAIFDVEYARWLDDDHRHMAELRTALQAHLTDSDLRLIVDGYIAHYDEIFRLKGVAAKSDVFHLITGMWTSPAERCFLWIGGFRPSDLIKMLITQLDPLTEQQIMSVYSLQQSSQQAEEALSQGLEQLQRSLIDSIANGSVSDSMHHMATALAKLSDLEGFVQQADNLRQQTLHQLLRILTVRQAARCFLVIGEYYGRLRALSSLWASRPREMMIGDENCCHNTSTELQMLQQSSSHFSNF
ncbi:transcription factor TGA2.2-like isoform X1 [Andrographis paniculata]|uniref:transcription factor TGA2.2-like isoform X1 n=1 Tax=Andrographis paniculata TaxID=175694 RepID=UPI0021E90F70|nr:transcription factor TGA2.2-like isoform X1 [Andrographis paniculata]